MIVNNKGSFDYYLEEFDEFITGENLAAGHVQNLVMGKLYIDWEGVNTITNRKNGFQAKINFTARGWTTQS